MPRAALPPTPASSTDIKGKDGFRLASLQLSFELPPPAMTPSGSASDVSTTSSHDPSNPANPLQASETVKTRRRSSAAHVQLKDQFALPPPPTRSRKIIQMKPREEPAPEPTAANTRASSSASRSNTLAASAPASTSSKRKQPSATSAAGRKIARKTAHSLIERRRRSKMNDEFALLKSMIPACTGEMHKLAILQASIEYVRYLEDCVAQLKARHGTDADSGMDGAGLPSPSFVGPYNPEPSYAGDPCSPDVEMTSSEAPSPELTPNAGPSQLPSVSPALLPQGSRHRHDSYSSASYSTPATTSPAFGPQTYVYTHSTQSTPGSTLTSPALPPQRDPDQEATAALLMLNQMDRRGAAGRGMSVKDMLTT
ncbi:hypothetical protein B0T24DRAFT_538277 [Lasiosphaeria ovina]|uniref:BHLH domain-containing protein n=1 Tax=Lasiosphaeria ovina TaxID=92902 RepID=A0AAE0JUK7_9PEZI|nr:hypothetical protein B0T24DRAFT_538277 [Lasiosphaeria ovina]